VKKWRIFYKGKTGNASKSFYSVEEMLDGLSFIVRQGFSLTNITFYNQAVTTRSALEFIKQAGLEIRARRPKA
jgi:hypothetical protein